MARSVFSLCALLIVLVTAEGVKFDCPALPPLTQPAKNVYELKPQDIKVVMALGDSITAGEQRSAPTCSSRYFILSLSPAAGFGMMGRHGLDILEDLQEYRVKLSGF